MKKQLCFLIAAIAMALFFSNCASLTGFQTGRTVGKYNGEVLVTLNASSTPKFDLDVDQDDTSDLKVIYFPNLELSGRFGLHDKFDIGLKLNTNTNIAIDGRYQFIGDQETPVAAAVGLSIGTFGLIAPLWNLQLPLYFSMHPTEALAIYINPRYTRQFGTGDLVGKINYLGGNAGLLIGKKVQFGLDAGVHNLDTRYTQRKAVLTFGVGVKVPIGKGNDD